MALSLTEFDVGGIDDDTDAETSWNAAISWARQSIWSSVRIQGSRSARTLSS